ncbi:hypothetical protein J4G66_19945 [Aeromonas dhakensis]|uniref:hypothetical protein n=1 Tax=Aeromonas dhakensis TaxID=196024 RepID=UPI001BCBB223|nr:hypothetical protein [Aeromonas dhakensis]MBS4718219.1 hypothetical protein [Aeromonas dhakensis]
MKNSNVVVANCLKSWASLLGHLAENVCTRKTRSGLQCKVSLPSGHSVVAVGEDFSGSVRNLLIELTKHMSTLPECELGIAPPFTREVIQATPGKAEFRTQGMDESQRMDTAATKVRRETIGVTTKRTLHTAIVELATAREVDTSIMARSLLKSGWERFREARITRDPDELLDQYENVALSSSGTESEQWMIRVDRKLAIKIQSAAKEYERSASAITRGLLAEALHHESTVASPFVEFAETPDKGAVKNAIVQIGLHRGPAARQLARQVGLGEQRALMNEILSGAVISPIRVLNDVAKVLKLPSEVLKVALNDSFQLQTVSGFKVQEGKPEVRIQPQTWQEAVSALELLPDEEQRLLSLDQ